MFAKNIIISSKTQLLIAAIGIYSLVKIDSWSNQNKFSAGSQPLAPLQVQVRKPNELFYSKIIPLLNEKGLTEQTPRKDWPNHI